MRKTSCLALLLIVWCAMAAGQTEKDKPRLLARLNARGEDVLNEIYKLGMDVESNFDSDKDRIAIRVCSKDPLPVALSMAKGLPFATTVKLERLGIPQSRIYYLRQSRNCRTLPNNYALTEYWLIPGDADFPEFDQSAEASCLSGSQLTNADSLTKQGWLEVDKLEGVTPQSYKLVLDGVVKQLKQDKSGVVVVRVPYYGLSPTFELKSRVRQTVDYLKTSGIASHRVYVRRIYSGSRPAFHNDEPQYPDVFLISLN